MPHLHADYGKQKNNELLRRWLPTVKPTIAAVSTAFLGNRVMVPTASQSILSLAAGSARRELVATAVISAVINLLMLTGPLFMLQVYDRVLSSRSEATLVALTLLIVILFAFMAYLDGLRARVLARVGLKTDRHLRAAVFDAMVDDYRSRRAEHDGQQAVRDLDAVRSFLGGPGPTVFFDLPWMPLYLGAVFLLHPLLGLLAVAGAMVVIILTIVTDIVSKGPAKRASSTAGYRNSLTDGALRNVEAMHALGMTGTIRERWLAAHAATSVEQVTSGDTTSGISASTKAFRLFLQSAILAVGAYLVLEGQATGGVMIAASVITARALAPVEQALGLWKGFIAFRQSRARLEKILSAPRPTRTNLPPPSRILEVANLGLGPPNTKTLTLTNITFVLEAGDGLAVIGPSAAGKSTLARALVGVWPAARGDIRLDGAALDQWDSVALGRHVGYLPQSVELFDGTIAENISRFDPRATSQQIVAAGHAAGAHDMILHLPQGYDTRVGAQGIALSGGQRQRIGLARALYGNPFLVVLDEPNANLDADGEMSLAQAIRAVRARKGIVIVMAHRPSALAEVDLVLVLRDGTQGPFGQKDFVLRKAVANPEAAMARPGSVSVA